MGKLGAAADRQYAEVRNIRLVWEDYPHGPEHVRYFDSFAEAKRAQPAFAAHSSGWVISGIQFGQGLMRQTQDGWHRLTPYGVHYLAERS